MTWPFFGTHEMSIGRETCNFRRLRGPRRRASQSRLPASQEFTIGLFRPVHHSALLEDADSDLSEGSSSEAVERLGYVFESISLLRRHTQAPGCHVGSELIEDGFMWCCHDADRCQVEVGHAVGAQTQSGSDSAAGRD